MIDYAKIELAGAFPPLGKPLGVQQPSGHTTSSFTSDTYYLFGNGADFSAHLSPGRDLLTLGFCPPKILQGHNGLGSNDLIGVVRHAVLRILAGLKVKIDKAMQNRLKAGDYRLIEVHINELHTMPHAAIPALVHAIRRYGPDSLQAIPIEKGIGVRLWPNSDARQVLIYDKVAYFNDKPNKHHDVLHAGVEQGTFAWFGLNFDFDDLLAYLRQGVRIEVKLKRPFLKRVHKFQLMNGPLVETSLDRGSYWTADIANAVRRAVLQSVPLGDRVLTSVIDTAIGESSPVDATLLALWQAGRDPKDFNVPASTYYRRRTAILSKYGFDISTPWVDLPQSLTWTQLIDDSGVIERAPKWARGSGFVFKPKHPRQITRSGHATTRKKKEPAS